MWAYIPNVLTKTQATTMYTLHIIAKYVPDTNMPTELGISAI